MFESMRKFKQELRKIKEPINPDDASREIRHTVFKASDFFVDDGINGTLILGDEKVEVLVKEIEQVTMGGYACVNALGELCREQTVTKRKITLVEI